MCGFGDKVSPTHCASGPDISARAGSAAARPRGSRKVSRSERRRHYSGCRVRLPFYFPLFRPLTLELSEIDYTFFLATVDLWSEDGRQEMNLVLHPTSSDRSVPFQSKARKRLNSIKARPSTNGTPVPGPSAHPTSQADTSVSRSKHLIVPSPDTPDTHSHRREPRIPITPVLQMTITLLIPSNHRIRRR